MSAKSPENISFSSEEEVLRQETCQPPITYPFQIVHPKEWPQETYILLSSHVFNYKYSDITLLLSPTPALQDTKRMSFCSVLLLELFTGHL